MLLIDEADEILHFFLVCESCDVELVAQIVAQNERHRIMHADVLAVPAVYIRHRMLIAKLTALTNVDAEVGAACFDRLRVAHGHGCVCAVDVDIVGK